MSQKTISLVIAGLILLAAGWYWYSTSSGTGSDGQVKTPHFVDATPLHGEVYAAQPINITINFNFDLASGSSIRVTSSDGQEWHAGGTSITDVNTALQVPLKARMPDGAYTAAYTACWPDGSCHDGKYSFSIDSSKQALYEDHRGEREVSIAMKNIAFENRNILISPGTTVTWINDDTVGHFVNTETHPEHTYFVAQNSREIPHQGTYRTTFTTPGQYNYHCSAHVPEGMLGSIIVAL